MTWLIPSSPFEHAHRVQVIYSRRVDVKFASITRRYNLNLSRRRQRNNHVGNIEFLYFTVRYIYIITATHVCKHRMKTASDDQIRQFHRARAPLKFNYHIIVVRVFA